MACLKMSMRKKEEKVYALDLESHLKDLMLKARLPAYSVIGK
jgi:hypothetical protein